MVVGLTQAPANNHCGHSGVPTQFSILPECSLVCRLAHGKSVSKICCVTAPVGMFSGGTTDLKEFLVSLCLLTQDDLHRSTDLVGLYIA